MGKKGTSTRLYETFNYKYIRNVIKELLFSPSINKKTIVEKGIIKSESNAHTRFRNINFYTGKKLNIYKVNNEKYNTILNDLYEYPTNYFTDTYMYCSYTVDELFFYIIYLQGILKHTQISHNYFTLKEIHSIISEELNIQLKPNKKIFEELAQSGIIEFSKNKSQYKLTDNVLNYTKNNFLENLQDMVNFFYNHHFLAVPGYYLSKTINQYQLLNNKPNTQCHYNPANDNIFAYRYVPKHNTIDNNILWDILEAIKHKQSISYSYTNQDGTISKYSMIPIKVVIENEYGKQYCYGYDTASNQYFLSRIDMMEDLTTTENTCDNKDIYKHFDEDFVNRWIVANNKGSYPIRVYFNFPEKKKKVLKRHLEDNKRFGVISEDSSGLITFDITISDYFEIIPFINSFGEYAIVDKEICPELYEQIKKHNNKLKEIYEII